MDSVLIILLANDAKLGLTAGGFSGGFASGQCKFADETACYWLPECQRGTHTPACTNISCIRRALSAAFCHIREICSLYNIYTATCICKIRISNRGCILYISCYILIRPLSPIRVIPPPPFSTRNTSIDFH